MNSVKRLINLCRHLLDIESIQLADFIVFVFIVSFPDWDPSFPHATHVNQQLRAEMQTKRISGSCFIW